MLSSKHIRKVNRLMSQTAQIADESAVLSSEVKLITLEWMQAVEEAEPLPFEPRWMVGKYRIHISKRTSLRIVIAVDGHIEVNHEYMGQDGSTLLVGKVDRGDLLTLVAVLRSGAGEAINRA